MKIDLRKKLIEVDSYQLKEGDQISIDGSTGQVILGEVSLIDPELTAEFKELLSWADRIRHLQVRANADNPIDAQKARELGAEGIGLCRTEHMFMDVDRVPIVRKMILAESAEEREAALDLLLPMQKNDFVGIFQAMNGLPVTIRLLDPPLHEFLPHVEDLSVELTQLRLQNHDHKELIQKEAFLKKVRSLQEFNPMLGHRGCRLGLIYPEIYIMQVEAIFLAANECMANGVKVQPEIMIPLVGHQNELKRMKELVEQVATEMDYTHEYTVGTMIEVPRAAVTADQIAEEADFFSFGTNDLTQTTFGFSRDDAEGKFLHQYLENNILEENPFISIDQHGVGALIQMGVEKGRQTKKQLKTGICGEHGGEKRSIEFCHTVGLDYVSCSPFRVPLARLSSAQAMLKANKEQLLQISGTYL